MALTIARTHPSDDPDGEALRQVAEVGLAQAILSWRQRDSTRFDRYARVTIIDQLRRHDGLMAARRHRP
jgi:DNA-directed RNA polymerase specialized sigma subunit